MLLLSLKGLIVALKPISKEEKFALVKKYPQLENKNEKGVVRTMVQDSKRGHYWVVENKWVLQFLENYWNSRTVERLVPGK